MPLRRPKTSIVRVVAACGVALGLANCAPSSFLPESGPSANSVLNGAQFRTAHLGPEHDVQYVLVTLTAATVARVPADDGGSFALPLRSSARSEGRIGLGDVLGITIFESDSGGLFLPREPGTRAGNFVTLPTQQVDKSGNVTIPYAGAVRAAGRTPAQVQKIIEDRLATRALDPQVVVTVIERRADAVSVLGDVTTSAHFALDPGGDRVLGAIARAGGPKFPAYETIVTLQRDGLAERALLSDIAQDPAKNVEIQAGDSIYVSHEPRYFLALGATGTASSLGPIDRRIPFQDSKMSLLDALARGGGLQDDRAYARGAFLYRAEPRSTLVALGLDGATLPEIVPTVYYLDLGDPAGFFHARRFPMHTEDVIYVSNAPATDVSKFISVVLPFTSGGQGIRATVAP